MTVGKFTSDYFDHLNSCSVTPSPNLCCSHCILSLYYSNAETACSNGTTGLSGTVKIGSGSW